MKTTKTYLSGCMWCAAIGRVGNPDFNPNRTEDTMSIVCPVCNDNKTIIVTEVTEYADFIPLPALSDDPKGLLMARLTERLTLRDVWKETGIAISTISRIENGKPARYSTVKALFNFYNSINEKRKIS